MHAYSCQTCGHLLAFENCTCLRCGAHLGFCPDRLDLLVLAVDDPRPTGPGIPVTGVVHDRATGSARRVERCALASSIGCNWLVPTGAGRTDGLCRSCALTRIRPADGDETGLDAWTRTEQAKRRVVHQLLDRGLPVTPRTPSTPSGLAFDLLLPVGEDPVVTGHADGVITIDLREADDAHREHVRRLMGEPYRTMVGHLRHELGHHFWSVLVQPDPAVRARVDACFGDAERDYQQALDGHHREGPPSEWPERFVSAYATAHPWEDWAETFAHVLHIEDALQTATAFGLQVRPRVDELADADQVSAAPIPADLEAGSFTAILEQWLPLTYALNALNRGMGRPELYPFVLAPPAIAKLELVHELLDAACDPS